MTSPTAREAVLSRLRAAHGASPGHEATGRNAWSAPELPPAQRLETLIERLRAVRAEVLCVPEADWPEALRELLAKKRPESLAFGPGAWFAPTLAGLLAEADMPRPLPYDRPLETFKDDLFKADAALTAARAGIAENGSLLLTPDGREARLLSLVPPLHVVLLRASDVLSTFAQALELLARETMPPNALLVSGPSKTADIELTLAFGVHGPRELVVLLLE